jgi:phosphoglycerate kinase
MISLQSSNVETQKKMLTMEDIELKGKRVFVRVDINTPVHPETGELIERARINEAAITISELKDSKVVVGSHQGRVGRSDFVSLEKHAIALSDALGKEVHFIPDVFGPAALETIDKLKDGDVLLLDNLRLASEENTELTFEQASRTIMIKRLSSHIDACILDAFSTAHRASASIIGFAEVVPTCAGKVVAKELRALEKIFAIEKGPYVTLLGGSKVSDRLEAIDALIANKRADKILLSGLIGLVFLKAAGRYSGNIGIENEEKFVQRAKQLMEESRARYELPIDVAISNKGTRKEIDVTMLRNERVMDVGTKTIERFSRLIKGAGTVFMSGPPGAFEYPEFSKGTEMLLRAMASSFGTTIVSGGHLSTALQRYNLSEQIDHVSTAGGALVQYLAGKKLPLVEALERAATKWNEAVKV